MDSKYRVCCAHDIRTDENRQKSLPSCREREIEKYFVQQVKKNGGLAPKFVSPGWDGVPDRLVLLPDGRMAFVELRQETASAAGKAEKAAGEAGLSGIPH